MACFARALLSAILLWASIATARANDGPPALKSGSLFLSPELRALQADDFANPGMLWVSQGKQLWGEIAGAAGKSCASCHGDAATSMSGVAARYPAVDKATGQLLNMELRINACRQLNMKAEALGYESENMLSLSAYMAFLSRGVPRRVSVDGAAAPYYERGKTQFFTRQGQLNLSCAQCHVDYAERKLRGDIISHGLTQGYPIYRLEWQSLGSVHRRLRSCAFGVRAVQWDYGSPEYLALELYLAKRADGMPMEAPAIRK
jgi:sulfur-oxidizing protein SoxA